MPTSGLALGTAPNLNLAIPFWEAVGPWDVDNDNDGIPDSIWVDLGDPVQEAEDGTRYKPLYAFLIIDLDSRLNVNAHGLADDIVPPALAVSYDLASGGPMTGAAAINLAGKGNSNYLAEGVGYGPAEISLRSVFPAPLDPSLNPLYGNRVEASGLIDNYATLMFGRLRSDGIAVDGKYGFVPNGNYPANPIGDAATAGANYRYLVLPAAEPAGSPRWYTGEVATPSLLAQLKFFDYPWSLSQLQQNQSGFGSPPDLKRRYAIGLDYSGQPVAEVAVDTNPNDITKYYNLIAKTAYEIDLSRTQRPTNGRRTRTRPSPTAQWLSRRV